MGKKRREQKRKGSQKAARQANQSIKRLANPGRKPTRAAALAGKAAAAWNQLEFDRALKLFHTAHIAERGNVDVLLDLGRAHLLRYDPDTAQEWFDRAIHLSGRSAATLLRVGESYRKIPRYDLALPWFREAASLTDCPVDGLVDTGTVAERLHQLDVAQEAIDRALSVAPDHPAALLLRAKLQRRSGDPAAAETTLRDLVSRNDLRRQDAAWQARYQLGVVLDRSGHYTEAMAEWQAAKKILQREGQNLKGQSESVFHETRRMVDTISAEHFKRWRTRLGALDGGERPVAILTGHPRSGTTLLEQILDSHQDLISSDESTIFGDDVTTPLRRRADAGQAFPELLDALPPEEIAALRDRYFQFSEAFVGEPIGSRILLDKNPALTMQLPSMCAILPGLKIVFALRDPRDVVISCYMQALFMNSISCNYLDLGSTCRQYAAIMDSWLKVRELTRNSWTEIRYEDLVDEPENESRRILEFLGLPWDPDVMDFHQRARTRYVSSPTYEAVTKKIHRGAVGRWQNYEEFLAPHLETLGPYVEAFGYE